MQYEPVAGLCARCGAPVRPNEPYTYREIIATEMVSRTGGVDRLKHKEYTGKVYCRAHGTPGPDQASLFNPQGDT